MDLNKANFSTIIKFGTLEDFKAKLSITNEPIHTIINKLDNTGMSLLEHALVSRKFEIAEYLIDIGSPINTISNEGFNELHYLASNINSSIAINIANRLLDLGVDINCIDKKYQNTAGFSLCLEILKKQSDEGLNFIIEILKRNPILDAKNVSDNSLRSLLLDRGPEVIKNQLK